ncbi:hypothetical protein [Sphingomonas sp. DT-204]|uniref:hypothetical protein n=1 Tax=Sphingomonas sp. DT-204 TaxID=3396166 RepID=UPI003F19A628
MAEGTMTGLMVIVGPLLLLIVIAWAMLHNRRSRTEHADSERATRQLYEEQGRADRP